MEKIKERFFSTEEGVMHSVLIPTKFQGKEQLKGMFWERKCTGEITSKRHIHDIRLEAIHLP